MVGTNEKNMLIKRELMMQKAVIVLMIMVSISWSAFISAGLGPSSVGMPGLGQVGTLSSPQILDRYADQTAVTAKNKYNMPDGVNIGMNRNFSSCTKHQVKVHHPAGADLFPDDAALGQSLASFLQAMEQDSYFLVFFSKIHTSILHELYQYLTSVYSTFAMTHIDDMNTYLSEEEKTALNKKTLIVSHLVNIIEAQLNSAIRARFPSLPKNLATYTGTLMVKHDYGSDLTLMLEKSEVKFVQSPEGQAMIKNTRSSYLTIYSKYLAFFNRYTQGIQQIDMSKGYATTNAFVKHAQRIGPLIEQFVPKPVLSGDSKTRIKMLRDIQRINPPLFFYNDETMRGLKLIPLLASQIPANVGSIDWPQQLKDAANKKETARTMFGESLGYPVAQYSADGKKLFVNLPVQSVSPNAPSYYSQELLPQPKWLNSSQGILLMLRACLGDFSAVLDPIFDDAYILDPCIECITRNAAVLVNLGTHDQASCPACTSFISGIEKRLQQEEEAVTIPAGPGDGGGDQAPPPPPGI
jgi:hypothetical protein